MTADRVIEWLHTPSPEAEAILENAYSWAPREVNPGEFCISVYITDTSAEGRPTEVPIDGTNVPVIYHTGGDRPVPLGHAEQFID